MPELHPLWEEAIAEGRVDRAKAEHLAARFPDVAEQTCDRCAKLIVPLVEAHYGAADPGPRHYSCTGIEKTKTALAQFDEKYNRAMSLLGELRGAISENTEKQRHFDRIAPDEDDGLRPGPVRR